MSFIINTKNSASTSSSPTTPLLTTPVYKRTVFFPNTIRINLLKKYF